MVKFNFCDGGRAFRIAIGIMLVVVLLAGGAGAATPISDCTDISSSGTYVLTQSIENSTHNTCISITSSNVIFDGGGYTIDGVDETSTYGVYVYNSSNALINITVKNLLVMDWDIGINYRNVTSGNIINNTASSNEFSGILIYSRNNNISNNKAISNGLAGIYLYNSTDNTFRDNTIEMNDNYGIFLFKLNNNNTFINNVANSNRLDGIILHLSSNNNTLIKNNASLNGFSGILIDESDSNTIINNKVSSNAYYGIQIYSSYNNTIFNNFFNNTNNFWVSSTVRNIWNSTITSGINIVGGPYIGGNFWANQSGSGFSQTCTDSDEDGICDSPYILDSENIDYLPLAYNIAPTSGGINGDVAYGPMTWNATNFPAFWQEDGIYGETLAVVQPDLSDTQRTIESKDSCNIGTDGCLVYTTERKVVPYKVYTETGLTVDYALDSNGNKQNSGGYFAKLGWVGKPYVAVNGNAKKLAKLLIEHGSLYSEKKTLTVGETWDMGDGWTLTAQSIDAKASPRQAWFVLSHNGVKLDDRVIAPGEVYTYVENSFAGETDVPLFLTYVDSVFAGATSDYVQLRYTWLISKDINEVQSGDEFGVFEASATSSMIYLKLDKNITLFRGSTINLFDNLYFVVNDTPSLEYYPMMTVTMPPPTIGLTIDPRGYVERLSGEGMISGTLNCSIPMSLLINGEVNQRAGRFIVSGSFNLDLTCDGETTWSATVPGGPFKPGKALVNVTAVEYSLGVDLSDDESAVIKLKPSKK